MQQPTYPSGRDHNDQSNILTLVINSLLIDKYVVVMQCLFQSVVSKETEPIDMHYRKRFIMRHIFTSLQKFERFRTAIYMLMVQEILWHNAVQAQCQRYKPQSEFRRLKTTVSMSKHGRKWKSQFKKREGNLSSSFQTLTGQHDVYSLLVSIIFY